MPKNHDPPAIRTSSSGATRSINLGPPRGAGFNYRAKHSRCRDQPSNDGSWVGAVRQINHNPVFRVILSLHPTCRKPQAKLVKTLQSIGTGAMRHPKLSQPRLASSCGRRPCCQGNCRTTTREPRCEPRALRDAPLLIFVEERADIDPAFAVTSLGQLDHGCHHWLALVAVKLNSLGLKRHLLTVATAWSQPDPVRWRHVADVTIHPCSCCRRSGHVACR